MPSRALVYKGCESDRAVYEASFPESGYYTISAQSTSIKGVESSCAITYRAITVLPTRVHELHPALAVLIAFAALFLLRKRIEGIRRNR